MEEERFVVGFHQIVEKKRQKSWNDRHIRIKPFKVRGLMLLHDSKFFKHPRNLKTHWLGPYMIVHITDVGIVKLKKLDGTYVTGMVNKIRLKSYYDGGNIPGWNHAAHEKKSGKSGKT